MLTGGVMISTYEGRQNPENWQHNTGFQHMACMSRQLHWRFFAQPKVYQKSWFFAVRKSFKRFENSFTVCAIFFYPRKVLFRKKYWTWKSAKNPSAIPYVSSVLQNSDLRNQLTLKPVVEPAQFHKINWKKEASLSRRSDKKKLQ